MRYLTFTKEIAGSQISCPVSRIARRSTAVVVAAALGISVAACSSEDSDDGAADKETVTTTVQESAEASGSSEESEQPRNAQAAPAQESSGSKLHKISVDGKAADTKLLSPVRCELGEDDGREVLEVDFGKDDSHRTIALSVEFTCAS